MFCAGRPEPHPEEWQAQSGYLAFEGDKYGTAKAQPELRIRLATPDQSAAHSKSDLERGTLRSDVSVLLGGCGDFRLFLCTLIDAVNEAQPPSVQGTKLRFALNDICPEVIARCYITMTILQQAADSMPADAPLLPTLAQLPDGAAVALTHLWHIYHGPALHQPTYKILKDALESTAAASGSQLPWLECMPGTWGQIQDVCAKWLTHEMTVDELTDTMAHSKQVQQSCDTAMVRMHGCYCLPSSS